jgi:transcriptional regulator with PAS, ATPase and Fis domain
VREEVRRAAQAPYPVLVQGESGSGKELVARAIHARSGRRARKFCAINCAALSDDLLEAELFGHARGAFTGAVGERAGLFEEADQGTIFLDEAGELSGRAQAKLLRVLQEGEIRRVGENVPRKVDARVVAATNRCLEAEVAAGRFRADLRFRLDVVRIVLPPLRDRADEVPGLARRIWSETIDRVGSRATLGDDVLAALARYDWPGNVREMQNVMASLAVNGPRRGRIHASLLPAHVARAGAAASVGFEEARLEFERRFVRAALARAGGRRTAAANQLGVSRQGLAKIIKRLGIVESQT